MPLNAEAAADVGATQRMRASGMRSTVAASRRTQCTTCVADQIVTASVRGS